ncbi:MAG: phytoene/squalene synthase family protein [bacterium]
MHPDLPLCYDLLPRVSRTFALNIRILPGELRPAVTVAYLLFRYADTIEDAPCLAPEHRTELFEAFLDRLDGGRPLVLPHLPSVHLREAVPAAEGDLLARGEQIFAVFESLPDRVREIIASHVAETARGMERVCREHTRRGLLALETWKDLEEYCYYVAGTIGIMLTRLFAAHSRHIDAATGRRLTALGTSFGRGLQLTNILKGMASDRREGRVYLPAEALRRHGTSPEALLAPDHRTALLAVVDEVLPRALQDLEDALRYTILLPRREPRLRLFCLWPLFTAVRTLAVVARGKGLDDAGKSARVTRPVLYREMALSTAHVFSNGRLRKRFERFRRELFPARPRREVWAGP